MSGAERDDGDGPGPAFSVETKTTMTFAVAGLTLWYLTSTFDVSDPLPAVALFGVGIVLPAAINEWRKRRRG